MNQSDLQNDDYYTFSESKKDKVKELQEVKEQIYSKLRFLKDKVSGSKSE